MTARLEIAVARIETLAVDAIVNAANNALAAGSGVDGAIRRAAGAQLNALLATQGPLRDGAALVTPGFDLPAKQIIHTVAPIYSLPRAEADKHALLAACYRSCLMAAQREGVASIAFPALGTGVYGWPKEIACAIAVGSVREQLAYADKIERVVFCCFVEADAAFYRDALAL